MSKISMNNNQIIAKLNSDTDFAINFIIDNNPDAVQSNLTSFGIDLPNNPTKATLKGVINQLIDEGRGQQVIEALTVPYLNETTNYTGGILSSLEQVQAQSQGDTPIPKSATALAVLGALSTIGGGILNIVGTEKQIDLQNEQQETLEQARLLEQQKKVFGLPVLVFVALLVMVGVVLIFAIRKGTK